MQSGCESIGYMPGSPIDVVHFGFVLRELSTFMLSPSSMHLQPSSIVVALPSFEDMVVIVEIALQRRNNALVS